MHSSQIIEELRVYAQQLEDERETLYHRKVTRKKSDLPKEEQVARQEVSWIRILLHALMAYLAGSIKRVGTVGDLLGRLPRMPILVPRSPSSGILHCLLSPDHLLRRE